MATERETWEALFGAGAQVLLDAIAAVSGGGGLRIHRVVNADFSVPAAAGTDVVLYVDEVISETRFVQLPPAAGPAQVVLIKDAGGNATKDNSISFVQTEGDTLTGGSTDIGNSGGGYAEVTNDGVASWFSTSTSDANALAMTEDLQALQFRLDAAGATTAPTGGAIVDAEARAAVAALITALAG